jgi:hypothetical protein
LAQDLLEAARGFANRTKYAAMELEMARHVLAKFTLLNIRMTQAIYDEQGEGKNRQRRNIFGSIIGTLTGLVTAEEMRAAEEKEAELERKVKTVLTHDLEVEKAMQQVEKEIAGIYYKGRDMCIRMQCSNSLTQVNNAKNHCTLAHIV